MGDLPSRDELVEELHRLREEGEGRADVEGKFVGNEVRISLYALANGNNALARGELLGGLQYLRLATETALRIRWIAGDGEPEADEQQRPRVDPRSAQIRIASMAKRDYQALAKARKAIGEVAGGGDPDNLVGQLQDLAARIDVPAAPDQIRQLATSSTGNSLYAGHRLCSSLIHPGAALGRGDLMPRETAEKMTDETAYLAAAFADAILRALAMRD